MYMYIALNFKYKTLYAYYAYNLGTYTLGPYAEGA